MQRRFNWALLIGSIVLVPLSIITGWIDSVRFVSYLSEVALIWTAWVAVAGHATPREVVSEIVTRTELNEAIEDTQEES
jgi:hypothetical protein